jgi:ABC-2 type transport system ATP-binding protein
MYVPEHRPGETFPLVFHGHGFSASRTGVDEALAGPSEPDSIDSTRSIGVRTGDHVRFLWEAGYAVVSVDQRGFGRGDDNDDGNSGALQILDPDYEIQDAIDVLDWVEAHVPNISRDDTGNIIAAAIGSSYGGGFQVQLAALDNRLDALVPIDSWHSLLQSLVPNQVIKKGYTTGLCLAIQADSAESGRRTTNACNQGSDTTISARYQEDFLENIPSEGNRDELVEAFGEHGTAGFQRRHDDAGDPFQMRPVDVLLIQGSRDILFNMNQAANNFRFLESLGGDVRMITNESGHAIISRSLGGSQGALGPSSCGRVDSMAAMRSWLDLKLKGIAPSNSSLPSNVCLSLDNTSGVELGFLPVADSASTQFDPYTVSVPVSSVNSSQNNTFSATAQGLFVALAEAISENGFVLAGIPVGTLTIDDSDALAAANGGTTAFVGIGINRGGDIILVDDQVQPLRSQDNRTGETPSPIELIGVAEQLQIGDIPGVMIYGSFDQYEPGTGTQSNFSANNRFNISGSVRLPIFSSTVHIR